MKFSSTNLLDWCERQATQCLILLTAIVTGIFLYVTWWKFGQLLYDALDLGIYTQVVWNTSMGRWFAMSIHPNSYLGDHFEPLLLAIAPLYRLWADARVLLILQTLALTLPALPLFGLARNIFRETAQIARPQLLALLVASCFLLNPFLASAAVFEFHILVFFLLPFVGALYFAERRRLWPTLGCLLIALTIREDIALLIAPTGFILAWLWPQTSRRNQWVLRLLPFVASVIWFAIAITIIGAFSATGFYKFFLYYGGQVGSGWERFMTILEVPEKLLGNFFRAANLEFGLGLLVPFAFLPLLAPTALLLALPPFLEFALGAAESRTVLILHYSVLFLPGLFLATIFALRRLAAFDRIPLTRVLRWPIAWPLHLACLVLIGGTAYTAIILGPFNPKNRQFGQAPRALMSPTAALHEAASLVGPTDVVATTKRLLATQANRKFVYPVKYIEGGKQQLSEEPYVVAEPVSAMILEQTELVRPVFVYTPSTGSIAVSLRERSENLQRFVQDQHLAAAWQEDGVAVFQRDRENNAPLFGTLPRPTTQLFGFQLSDRIHFSSTVRRNDDTSIDLLFYWFTSGPISENYGVLITETLEDGTVFTERLFEPSWGMLPTQQWQEDKIYASRFVLSAPKTSFQFSLRLVPLGSDGKQLKLPAPVDPLLPVFTATLPSL